jgi:MFS family permease
MSAAQLLDASAPGAPDADRRWAYRPWQAVAPAVAIAAWGGNHFTPLLLMYRHIYGYSPVQVDAFVAFYVVGLVPGFLLAGPLSDRHGRRPLLMFGVLLSAAASVVLAFGSASIVWMCAGRLLAGVSVAIAIGAGASWIEELSRAPHESPPAASLGAKRSSLAITLGFGVGAGVSGALAQWGPSPTLLPYLVQITLALLAAVMLLRASETRSPDANVRSLLGDLRIPRPARGRFFRVVLPCAPWVFTAPALSYVVLPALLHGAVGVDEIAFATLLAVITLGAGVAVQPLIPRLFVRTGQRQLILGMALTCAGITFCAAESVWLSELLAVPIAILLGAAYGICLVSGLGEVQKMAGPDDLAGLTGVYCSLTYTGFLLPLLLAALASTVSYAVLLGVLAVVCLACCLTVARGLSVTSAGRAEVPASLDGHLAIDCLRS